MIWKAVGCLVLLLAGGYVSVEVTRFERRCLEVLDGYLALIYYIKGQIECYALPIRDILARADPTVIATCLGLEAGTDMRALIPALLASGEPPLPRMVKDSRLYLDSEVERLLSAFAGELGHTFRADQVTRCDHYITALDEERRRLAESMPGRLRVGTTLCLSVAIGAAILLW